MSWQFQISGKPCKLLNCILVLRDMMTTKLSCLLVTDTLMQKKKEEQKMEMKHSVLKKRNLRNSGFSKIPDSRGYTEPIIPSMQLVWSIRAHSSELQGIKAKTQQNRKNPSNDGVNATDYVVSRNQLFLYIEYYCFPINFRQELLNISLRHKKFYLTWTSSHFN